MSDNDRNSDGRFTREELYELVWQTPISRLAKRFGLSDVGLRKICVNNNIPVPSLGYWAKVAHGKRVARPSLPPMTSQRVNRIHIVVRPRATVPPQVLSAHESAIWKEAAQPPITVDGDESKKLHPLAAVTLRTFRSAKLDSEGLKHSKDPGVDIHISAASLNRVVNIVDALAHAVQERGHKTQDNKEGVRIVVDDVAFTWRLYEIRDRRPHHPTKEELKAQTRHDEYRARWPSLYSSHQDTKIYRTWDYFPSGRLAMSFSDTSSSHWDASRMTRHWFDRKNKRLEEYLGEAMNWLAGAAVLVKHRCSEQAERDRRQAEENELRKREGERRQAAVKRREFFLKKAHEFHEYERLVALAAHLETNVTQEKYEPLDWLIEEFASWLEDLRAGFARTAIEDEIRRLQLFTTDDVSEPSRHRV